MPAHAARCLAMILLACAFFAPSAHAQRVVCGITIPQVPGVTTGGIGPGANQNRNTITVLGGFFIEASTIRFNPGEGIVVRDGGFLVLCGAEGPNELRGNFTPDWAGITVESGGTLIVNSTTLRGGRDYIIRARGGSDVTIIGSELVDGPGRYIQAESGSRVEVVATTFRGIGTGTSPVQADYPFTSAIFAGDAEVIIDSCRFVDFPSSPDRDRGSNAGSVNTNAGTGRAHTTIHAAGGTLALTRTAFFNITAGKGGRGGNGSSGGSGANGENPFLGGAEDGEDGGTGQTGGIGGLGGDTTVLFASDLDDLFVVHNSISTINGGEGGDGGNGGRGGNGGDGADGGNSVIPFVDGGDGGNGGDGGDGGRGGRSGDGGFTEVFRIVTPNGPSVIANNTLRRISAGEPGSAGFGGNGGSRGLGGDGGNGGFGADDGTDGSNGSSGDTGARGPFGDFSVPWPFIFTTNDPQHVVRANNNIIAFRVSAHNGIAFQSFGSAAGLVDISGNLVFNQATISTGTTLGLDTIVVGDPLVDGVADFPVPPANSPAVDAGINALTPPSLMRDVLGRPRYADVLSAPDTGDNGGFPGLGTVDIGATEAIGVTCPLDTNMDGRIDRDDILDAIVGANFLDVAETLNNYEAGCGN